MNNTDKILDKVKKLLQLGESNFENEAMNAITKAKQLLKDKGLSMKDVQEHSLKEEFGDLGEYYFEGNPIKKYRKWEQLLATYIAAYFGCQLLVARRGNKSEMSFVGREEKIRVVISFYNWLSDKTVKESKKLPADQRIDFCTGFVYGLRNKIKREENTVHESSTDLILKNEVDVWLENNGYTYTSTVNFDVSDFSSYLVGKKMSEDISLNTQFGLKEIGAE